MMICFSSKMRATFAANYPEIPHILTHQLREHPLLELEAMAALAERLGDHSIEYNASDQPVGANGKPEPTGIPIGETIRNIETSGSWAVLKNIEQDEAYGALIADLLSEIEPQVRPRTGAMLKMQGFIFVTSPGGVTPFHFDPEHNILLQIRGSKVMTQFPAGDCCFAPDELHETYHSGGARELSWNDSFLSQGKEFPLGPGEAVFVPVMAPHFVRTGPEVSVSLSITWRSEWSYAEADARGFNRVLRQMGMAPSSPGRWPKRNLLKAYSYRALRKIGAV